MSDTLDLGCLDCRVSIWIGQRDYIYTAEPWTMEALGKFLVEHLGHKLQFDTDHFFCDQTGWAPSIIPQRPPDPTP